jgi:hypothetical protein
MMKSLMVCATFALAAVASAQTVVPFKRPDCSAYSASLKPGRACVRETRQSWQDANAAALQKTKLMFAYMARPDPKPGSEALKAVEKKIEGSFSIRFSVKPDGMVHDVRIVEVTEGIQPLARLWADTIAQWTFAKSEQGANGIEYRRIYLYDNDDDKDRAKSRQSAH